MAELKDPDQDLVEAARTASEGDLRAFEELIMLHRKRIVADCHYLTRDEGNAEDLAQDVFVKAFFGMKSFEGRSTFRHWLQRIKVNHCLNHLKTRGGRESVVIDEAAVESAEQLQVQPVASEALEAMDERRKIRAILEALPKTLRVALVMRDMDELSYEEIAKELSIGLSAAKMRVKRAREAFRESYAASEAPAGGHRAG